LYEDAFDLGRFWRGPARRLGRTSTAGRMLERSPRSGRVSAQHLYHGRQADAVLSDDRGLFEALEENAVPYLTLRSG